ncbi:glycosyltransferase [Sphingomonas oryzagri]
MHRADLGGVERTALRLCGQWRRDGLDVTVVLGRNGGLSETKELASSVMIAPDPGLPIAWIETLWMTIWLPGMIRRVRPDILFCPGNSYTIVAALMKLLMGRNCPPIVAKISNDLLRQDMPAPVRLGYHLWCLVQGRVIDHWVALSSAMKAEAAVILGIAPARMSVIANPVLDAARQDVLTAAGERSRASREAGRRFLAAGRLVRQKGFDILIEAFAQGAQPHDRLVIVGEGPARARLQRKIHRLKMSTQVQMPGHCHAIETYLACSDILVLSSRYEGLPGVVVEAMAADMGVIATDCCKSMRELIEEGYDGVVVPPAAVGALSLAIALAKPRVQRTEGPASSRKCRVEAIAQSYAGLFSKLVATKFPNSEPKLTEEPA